MAPPQPRQAVFRASTQRFLRAHPTVERLLRGFFRELLLRRPENVLEFAAGEGRAQRVPKGEKGTGRSPGCVGTRHGEPPPPQRWRHGLSLHGEGDTGFPRARRAQGGILRMRGCCRGSPQGKGEHRGVPSSRSPPLAVVPPPEYFTNPELPRQIQEELGGPGAAEEGQRPAPHPGGM
ncbi:RIIa domain-containing protein 1 isoform X1 [Cuculus canorus]|uniref:RIIa domain-containing protein 1 isoform X1 n=1 Tax=Cuculus canorus TaxID=55661 RepID=UPI0023AA2F0A|nr:RIIa domain-containing protein 1 isoform X1 [Cuculus canorus]